MPKKLYPSEPPIIFNALLAEVVAALPESESFSIHTDDPSTPTFAAALIDEHYPPQTQLPLDD